MEVRDAALVDRVAARPFAGYARHGRAIVEARLERVAVCVLLLAAAVLSGILLGSGSGSRR